MVQFDSLYIYSLNGFVVSSQSSAVLVDLELQGLALSPKLYMDCMTDTQQRSS